MNSSVFRLVMLSVILLSLASGRGYAQFEGIIESKNLTTDEMGAKQQFVMTMWIKKDMVKIENSAVGSTPATTMVYRKDKQVVWILNDDDKTYFAIPREEKSERPRPPRRPEEGGGYVVTRTGKTRTLLGYPSQQILIVRDEQRTELWGTRKLGDLFQSISRALGEDRTAEADDWTAEIMKLGFFPLSSTTTVRGKLAESQEVTKIEKKILSPDLFQLPSTYKKQSIDQMLEGAEQTGKK